MIREKTAVVAIQYLIALLEGVLLLGDDYMHISNLNSTAPGFRLLEKGYHGLRTLAERAGASIDGIFGLRLRWGN